MSAHLANWRPRALAPLVLTVALSGIGCPRPEAGPPYPAPPPESAVTASAPSVAKQLQSPRLPYEPAPAPTVTPILRKLVDDGWDVGAGLEAEITSIRSRFSNWRKIECFEVRFTSHQWRGKPVRIFGLYARPARRKAKLPALLLVHGGGGYATLERVVRAAGKGYAALSIDLPGKGGVRDKHSRSTGPNMTVQQIFTVKPEITDNYIYHAVLAQMRSVTFLRSREEVDGERIGLVGVSWGGATGLMTTSLDKRIKCFVNMFGSGFLRGGSTWHEYFDTLPSGEFQTWEDNFDASRYVTDITVPVLGLTGTNDNCYYLPRFMATLRAIKPTPDLLLRPNLDHKIDDVARNGYYKWLAVHLKGRHAGSPPSLEAMRVEATDEGVRLYVQPRGQVSVKGADVCYGEVGNIGWTNREWTRVKCAPDKTKSWWSAEFALPSQIAYAFATVYFADGSVLSTPVHSIARARIGKTMVALNAPFMYKDSLLVEAHHFGSLVGAEVQPDASAERVTLSREGRQADCSARRLGELYFVQLRDASEQLGGIVAFEDGRTTITM